ncbi:MAG: hypothetical protein U0Y08_07895 [Bacteroidia bacterium]
MKTLYKSLVLFALVAFTAGSTNAQSVINEKTAFSTNDWNARKDEALQKYAQDEYEDAIRMLKDFPEDDTAWVTANYFYVTSNINADHYQEAIAAAWKGLEKKPSQFRRSLFDLLGASYNDVEKYDSAIMVFQAGLKEYPGVHRFHYGMGVAYKGKKEYDKAMASFQTAVRLNPYHALSHFNMAAICMENNYIVPAMLSFQMVMLVDDPGDRTVAALSLYEKMAQGGWTVAKDSLYWSMPAGSNDFADLEKLIRSKIALADKYKSKVTLNYNSIVKQMQLLYEQIQFNAADTGFWMQYYVPFVKKAWENNHFPGIVYQAFAGLNDEDAAKQVKKNMPLITKMADFARTYWDKERSDYWMNQKLVDKTPWFNVNGTMKSYGTFDDKISHAVGYWRYFSTYGTYDSEGLFDEKGREQGKWKYYDLKGRLKAVRTAKDGQLSDSSWTYYPNGIINEINLYRNSKLNGVSIGNHFTGGISGKVGFKDDKRDGTFELYFENGYMRQKGTYKMDVPDGNVVEYYDNGQKSEEYRYVNGKIDGVYKSWHKNGVLKSEGNVTAGASSGLWKYYSDEGILEKEGNYKNGAEDGIWKEYDKGTVVTRQSTYTAGYIGEDVFYDVDGKLWSKIVYNKAKMMSYEYYDKSGKIISQARRDSKKIMFKSMYPNGNPLREGVYTDDGMDGVWKSWTRRGVLSEEENYEKGVMQGEQKYYYEFGPLKSTFNYKDGKKDGIAKEYHLNGKLSKQAMYKDGEQHGYYFEYYPDGTLSEMFYKIEGETNGGLTYFDVNGKKSVTYGYYLGHIQSVTMWDSTGRVLSEDVIPTGNGPVKMLGMGKNKPLNTEMVYKNGTLDGVLKEYYADGKLHTVANYARGYRNGSRISYDLEGKLLDELWYKDGDLDSVRTIYEAGKKESVRSYRNDMEQGTATWYYPNGKVETTGEYKADEREGYFMYYSYNGELRLRLKFDRGDVISYSYLGPDSNFVAEIPLKNSTGPVKAYFRNGKVSADFTYKNGYYEGDYTLYFPDGKVARKVKYVNTDVQGHNLEYYPDGKVWKDEQYQDDQLHGTSKYYYENGKLRYQIDYKLGKKHGASLIYDQTGKLTKKNTYYNDETID